MINNRCEKWFDLEEFKKSPPPRNVILHDMESNESNITGIDFTNKFVEHCANDIVFLLESNPDILKDE